MKRPAGARAIGHGQAAAAPVVAAVPSPPDAWHEAVWRKVQEVPPGHVASYGDVARALGSPEHSRHVGRALGALPTASSLGVVPWWRILNSAGQVSYRESDVTQKPGGGRGSHQQIKLEAEGICFRPRCGLRGPTVRDFNNLRWPFVVEELG